MANQRALALSQTAFTSTRWRLDWCVRGHRNSKKHKGISATLTSTSFCCIFSLQWASYWFAVYYYCEIGYGAEKLRGVQYIRRQDSSEPYIPQTNFSLSKAILQHMIDGRIQEGKPQWLWSHLQFCFLWFEAQRVFLLLTLHRYKQSQELIAWIQMAWQMVSPGQTKTKNKYTEIWINHFLLSALLFPHWAQWK